MRDIIERASRVEDDRAAWVEEEYRNLHAAINIRRSGMDAMMSDNKTVLCGGHV